ncbi:MAG: SRPBCC family protein [Planctomycetota bacterium]
MFKKILVVLVALIAAALIIVQLQPEDFKLSRSIKIAAPASEVFPHVDDFHNWEAWSPWAKLDPAAKNSFEGPAAGVGSIFKWSGNDKVGEGMMTIIESKPNERIKIKLDFIRPFKATNDTEFSFKEEDKQTLVTWTMSGKHNFVGKAMCLVMNMEKMVGPDFEKGLANLKAVVENKK